MTHEEHPRRAGRVDVELPVAIELSGETFGGIARNIGIGGMFVAADRVSRIGDELLLTFSIPGQTKSVSVRGEVRWVRASFVSERGDVLGMGLRFVEVSIDLQFALAGFFRKARASVWVASRSAAVGTTAVGS